MRNAACRYQERIALPVTESWTTDEFHEWQRTGKAPNRNRTSNTAANVEPTAGSESLGAQANPRFNSPVRIGVISYRKRLADPDGVSAKAAIDGLVHAGILGGDSSEFVQEVWYRQEKSKQEKTVLVIEEA